MSVTEKREEVLERVYDDMLSMDCLSSDEAKALASIANTLEHAREQERCRIQDAEIKDLEVIENTQREKNRRIETIVSICMPAITNAIWIFVMAYEMHATREFEVKNVETSSVSKWLKSLFPKIRAN